MKTSQQNAVNYIQLQNLWKWTWNHITNQFKLTGNFLCLQGLLGLHQEPQCLLKVHLKPNHFQLSTFNFQLFQLSRPLFTNSSYGWLRFIRSYVRLVCRKTFTSKVSFTLPSEKGPKLNLAQDFTFCNLVRSNRNFVTAPLDLLSDF